ncbi:hypothetical protein DCAR_0726769 [Daucus carota subsp. sativus]|uniref:Trichome birefringence-like N-terminal domain-containing protein n=1 Tax=Daucus carota subsp. sativus TaxID=79200 RepID=A0AAF1B5H2_DAUCS|nr:hypothetical protein DCAR_0726769 [Daucus carota subsp. sativus]
MASITPLKNFSRSRNAHALFILLLTLALFFFFSSSDTSPSVHSRLHAAPILAPRLASMNAADATLSFRDNITSCDIFDGEWAVDDSSPYPLYQPGSCPFLDDSFNCFKNGRQDSDYIRLRWKPHGCHIPRFDGRVMLERLRGKRVVFVGDSLNRNMWESLVCALREALADKSRVVEVSGRRKLRTRGFFSFLFRDYQCSIDFIKSPFLVQEWKISTKAGTRRETLRLDMIQGSLNKYNDADIIIYNTGHWWTHHKTYRGNNYFQEGNKVYSRLEVEDAYSRALRTWSHWVDSNINASRTKVCSSEVKPITNDTFLAEYPWMMSVLETVIEEMKTPVFYLNITKMTDYRKDGHPSIFRQAQGGQQLKQRMLQDCSHWCLPGVPDSWNELLYATLLMFQDSPI